MKYPLRCDHCGGCIFSVHLDARCAGGQGWQCVRCSCLWTRDFVLIRGGSQCPVHGEVTV